MPLFRRRGRLPLPPKSIYEQIGAEDDAGFLRAGEEFFGLFRDLCDLGPDEDVLDVGCGVGRMAFPLTRHLSGKGSYEGFDIFRDAVEWCQREVTPRFPNFRFQHADIVSVRYNPTGSVKGSEFRFPYDDASFDFAFLTSVFTHLLPDDLHRYMDELARVLRPGGRCLITYFLLNGESKQLIAEKPQGFSLIPQDDVFWVHSWDVPEWAVAYEEDHIRARHAAAGLPVREPVHFGAWCGRDTFLTAHDIVIADRRA